MRILATTALASLIGLVSPAHASPEEEARVVLIAWSEAYAARDHAAMADLHGPFARVRGMDVATHMGGAIEEFYYFEGQRAKEQSASVPSYDCQVFDDGVFEGYQTGLCWGVYTLKQTLTSGETRVRPARFSMALVRENNRWLIHDHLTTWVPAIVAECGTSIPADKLTVASVVMGPVAADLCSGELKTGSVNKPSLVEPAAATLPPAK